MKYKPDWPEARERWSALWQGCYIERPVISVTAPNGRRCEVSEPVDGEQKWLDAEYIVRSLLARFETTYFGGEAIPSGLVQAGWVAQTYGATPHFPLDTIWFEPVKTDWEQPPHFEIDWDSTWLRQLEHIYQALLSAAGHNDFMIGHACLLPGNDMLPLIIGSDEFLIGLSDYPGWVREAILQLERNRLALARHFYGLVRRSHEFWYGNVGWMPFWAPQPFVSTQSDISCMLSPRMFDEFIVPELELIGDEFGAIWYHLDGQSAFHHVPRLCSQSKIKVVQFTPEAGSPANGPHYMELYQTLQAAGKIVHVQLPPENVEPLVRNLDPALLCLDTYAGSVETAEQLLHDAVKWTRA